MVDKPGTGIQAIELASFDERYACYRLTAVEAEGTMVASLRQFGQLSPVVYCLRDDQPCLIDGYKRLRAARRLETFGSLTARRIEADEKQAKAAMYWLNQTGRRTHALEEAWLVARSGQ